MHAYGYANYAVVQDDPDKTIIIATFLSRDDAELFAGLPSRSWLRVVVLAKSVRLDAKVDRP